MYSPKVELLGVIDGYSSLRWRRRFYEPGEFELHCASTPENLALLSAGNILHRLDRREAGVIEGIVIEADSLSSEKVTVTGRFGSALLCQRIITPTIHYSGTVEGGMRKIVLDNAITRPIGNFTLGEELGDDSVCTFQVTGKNIQNTLSSLAKASGLGYLVRLDVPNQQWVFEVYKGIDKSVTQSNFPYVLFNGEFGNITGPKYTYNEQSYRNYAYVAGQGEGDTSFIVEVDQTNGESLRELWVDANDLQRTEDQSDEDYCAQLTQRGKEKLAEMTCFENFEADAVDTANFEYMVDWNLGDIVSFERWNLLLNQRITEVEEVYENGVVTITPVCGTSLPETLVLEDG
ncbi:siphovirus ReqiPepy6 Gp37-like family protein [Clostridium merdae]|uniref:siphovirus ReqiPepy6 Gp37-like family protein n=1 Tax=Clostridium merdae TaxID=1958780 RepID=UPI0013563ECC|nr:siphovirus ReqiPepy6 Gp37-like family protein [Clostridium merdae]